MEKWKKINNNNFNKINRCINHNPILNINRRQNNIISIYNKFHFKNYIKINLYNSLAINTKSHLKNIIFIQKPPIKNSIKQPTIFIFQI